jgi:putative intracellular protease/amidase
MMYADKRHQFYLNTELSHLHLQLAMSSNLTVAVCISDEVTLSDFVQPIEILAAINDAPQPGDPVDVPFKVVFDYVAPTMDPIVSVSGLASATFNPTKTYAEVEASGQQYDIIWVPAGRYN